MATTYYTLQRPSTTHVVKLQHKEGAGNTKKDIEPAVIRMPSIENRSVHLEAKVAIKIPKFDAENNNDQYRPHSKLTTVNTHSTSKIAKEKEKVQELSVIEIE